MIGWTPEQFWNSTPAELNIWVEAYIEQEEHKWYRTAWLAANIMNTQGTLKRPVTVEKLLGKKRKLQRSYWKEELRNRNQSR